MNMVNPELLRDVNATNFNIYKGKRIFLTGHTGFKGAWLALWLADLGAEVYGYSLEEPQAPASYTALGIQKLLKSETIANLNDFEKLSNAFKEANPHFVFHLAAQALVRVSYQNPIDTIKSNYLGTAHLLEVIRLARQSVSCVIVTSDKCYENDETGKAYEETDRLGGHDIYSMSKATSELLVASYRDSFFNPQDFKNHPEHLQDGNAKNYKVALATARAGNVIGGGDYALDRILPDCVRAIQANNPVVLRNPKAVRPWQHVLEPLSGYLCLGSALAGLDCAHEFSNNSTRNPAEYCTGFNFGPEEQSSLTVKEIVEHFLQNWGLPSWRIELNASPLHEALQLNLSVKKAKHVLNWRPIWDIKTALLNTTQWYKKYESASKQTGIMRDFTREQISKYSVEINSNDF